MADLRKQKRKPKLPKVELKEVDHVLFYPNAMRMDFDLNQFTQYPRIMAEREPAMRPYDLVLHRVELIEKKTGTPPANKHELHLKLFIEGSEAAIRKWQDSANSFSGQHKTMTASESLREYHRNKGEDVSN